MLGSDKSAQKNWIWFDYKVTYLRFTNLSFLDQHIYDLNLKLISILLLWKLKCCVSEKNAEVIKSALTHFFFNQCITIPFFSVCYRKLYSNRKRYDSAFLFFLLRWVQRFVWQREKEVITFWWTHFCFINKTTYRSTLYRSTSLIFQSRCLGRCKEKKWIFCDNEVTWLRLILLLRKRQSQKNWICRDYKASQFHFISFPLEVTMLRVRKK